MGSFGKMIMTNLNFGHFKSIKGRCLGLVRPCCISLTIACSRTSVSWRSPQPLMRGVITHKDMNKLTWKRVISYIGLVYFVPIVLSVIFKIFNLGSIGSTVLIYSLISLPIFILIYVKSPIEINHLSLTAIVGAVLSVALSTLLINYFMFLTYLFGIYDYAPM